MDFIINTYTIKMDCFIRPKKMKKTTQNHTGKSPKNPKSYRKKSEKPIIQPQK